MTRNTRRKTTARIVTFSGLLICLILLPFLVINLNIIIQTATRPDLLPSMFGHKALILLPDSADGFRDVGIVRTVDPRDLKPQDIIAYRQGQTFFIERISQMKTEDGLLSVRTTSGPESETLLTTVPLSQIEGVLVNRIPRLGGWALFMQTPIGLLLFMVVPICLFLLSDAWFRRGSPSPQTVADSV